MRINLDAALGDLERLIDRIAELIEWEKLAKQQRPRQVSPSFRLADHFCEEVDELLVSGWQLHREIREALARDDLATSPEQRSRWERRLAQLERRASILVNTAKLLRR